jgi:hypothetical protein
MPEPTESPAAALRQLTTKRRQRPKTKPSLLGAEVFTEPELTLKRLSDDACERLLLIASRLISAYDECT